MNYSSVRIPNSPSQRVYHYGIRANHSGHCAPITWLSEYGKHRHDTVFEVPSFLVTRLGYDGAMRYEVAQRIKFLRSL